MRRLAVVTLAALLATPALAQSGPEGSNPFERMNRGDLDSLVDARIAAVQAGLKLDPEQQKLWPPVEQALRAFAAERMSRRQERHEGRVAPPTDFMERLDRRSERLSRAAESQRALTSAMRPFWASLSERQKRLLPILIRPAAGMGRRFHHGWRGHHRMHEPGAETPDRGPGSNRP